MADLSAPFSASRAAAVVHLPLPGDVIGRLAHDRAGVEGRAALDQDPCRLGPAVAGGVVERRPAEAVGPVRRESFVDEQTDDLGRPSGRRGMEEHLAGRAEGLQVLPSVDQAPEEPGQALGRGLGKTGQPFLSGARHLGPFFEEEVDELGLAAPGGELERGGAELIRGVDVRAGFDEDAGRGRPAPLAGAEEERGPLVIVPRLDRGPALEERGGDLRPVAHRGDVERRIAVGIGGIGLGALVDEEFDEIGALAVRGVMEERQSLAVAGFDQLRGLLDHRLDGRDIALAQQLEDVLGGRGARPSCARPRGRWRRRAP